MIETKRLIIRQATTLDTNQILKFINSEFSKKYNPYDSYSEIRLWKHLKEKENYVLVLKDTNTIIGLIGLEEDPIRINIKAVALTYILDEEYTHQGYMSEGLKEVIRLIFDESDIDIISLRIISNNIDSIKIAERLCFTKEGLIRESIKSYDNKIYDQLIYSMTRKEYEENILL